MKRQITYIIVILFIAVLMHSCAGLQSSKHGAEKIETSGGRIMVFPFQNPYYKGTELVGIGSPFTSVFISELRLTGRFAQIANSNTFNSRNPIDITEACGFAHKKGYKIIITGIVTEWIDGATQWSGKVDVASLNVSAYNSENCKLITSASGKQNGKWLTFINAPATRFYQPLSKKIIDSLFQ